MFRPFTMKFSRMIGLRQFDQAIDYLRSGLKGDASDAASLELIANCHHWAGRDEEAIVACRTALEREPTSYDMHELLARLLVDRGEHENATVHVRKSLEYYPEPMPAIPGFYMSLFNAFCRIFPSFRIANPEDTMGRVAAQRTEWFHWAKQYLEWYDQCRGSGQPPMTPTKH